MARHTATEVARNFASFLDRVQHRGERVVIQRRGVAVAELCPVAAPPALTAAELRAVWQTLPHLDADDAEAFEAELAASRAALAAVPDPWE